MFKAACALALLAVSGATPAPGYKGVHLFTEEEDAAAGIDRQWESLEDTLLAEQGQDSLPDDFTWGNVNGVNYLTMSRNQHLPQYCGSCWAHGAVSSVADRIKIARGAKGADINLSVQHILNCNGGGSCHGGSVAGPFKFMRDHAIAYETANPYIACSHESKEGFCPYVDTTCTPMNTARTCSTFTSNGGKCVPIMQYPNATLSDYKSLRGAASMQAEIYANGPISCGIDASKILKYTTGIATAKGFGTDHVISVVGWGTDAELGKYWIIRNSWGQYWGEDGYMRSQFGALSVESGCAAGYLNTFTAPENHNQVHCFEDGSNCQ